MDLSSGKGVFVMYEPLASKLRPTSFDDVIGQDRVIGLIRRMLEQDKLVSLILYGPTGTGKTTIARLISEHFPMNHATFNASVDPKSELKKVVEQAKLYKNMLLIIDEIHRMNKDIQDYLLPYVEKGTVVIVGLTTENPYVSVNPAIRSRTQIFRLERISEEEIERFLKAIDLNVFDKNLTITDETYQYIATGANGEIRTAINMLELACLNAKDNTTIDLESAKETVGKPQISTDKNGNDYYDILSAFHKSVRGSDVNAALHYLARLIVAGDLESLLRRIQAIVYEDIGLANPMMGVKVDAACNICRHIGFPEAVNALGAITIEMCVSPKSNSAHLAVNAAIDDVKAGKTYKIPSYLINNPTYDDKRAYKYPHDFTGHIIEEQYLPDKLQGKTYYKPQTHSKLEKRFAEQYAKYQAIIKGSNKKTNR
jgi:putative ATPase